MIEHRYICTNCAMGWHASPYCPFPPPPPTVKYVRRTLTDIERRDMERLDQLERDGLISRRGEPLFRGWWILPVGLAVFFLILIIT